MTFTTFENYQSAVATKLTLQLYAQRSSSSRVISNKKYSPYSKIRKRLLEKSATAHCRSDHSRLHSASLCVFEHPSTPEAPPRDDYSDPITWWNSNMMQNKAGLPCYTPFETGLLTVLQPVYDEDVSQNAINQSLWSISYHKWRHTRATNCLYSALIRCRNDSILFKGPTFACIPRSMQRSPSKNTWKMTGQSASHHTLRNSRLRDLRHFLQGSRGCRTFKSSHLGPSCHIEIQ